jgi:hypothetical protein
VDIDDDVLASARAALGTTTLKGTVHAALVEAPRFTSGVGSSTAWRSCGPTTASGMI